MHPEPPGKAIPNISFFLLNKNTPDTGRLQLQAKDQYFKQQLALFFT